MSGRSQPLRRIVSRSSWARTIYRGFKRAGRYRWNPVHPVPLGLGFLNFLCQRVLGVNREVPFMVHFTSRVVGNVVIGDGVWESFAISGGCYVQGANGVEIGDGTLIGPGVKIISGNHDLETGRWFVAPPIRIGRACWIGANAVILPGVVLGDRVIVGAGAVVTKSFGKGLHVVGVPAHPVGEAAASTS